MVTTLMYLLSVLAVCYTWYRITQLQLRYKKTEPICGCQHHLAYHDRETGQCHEYQPGVMVLETKAKVKCKCRRYVGPEPLSDVYAEELTG